MHGGRLRTRRGPALILGCLLLATGCAHRGERAVVGVPGAAQRGQASWYGRPFHGRRTASGEIYNMYDFTAAHKTLPFGTRVRVTRRDTGASVVVRINDRGPFVRNRIIDLSYAAAKKIGLDVDGVAPVRLKVLGRGVAAARHPKPRPAPVPRTAPAPHPVPRPAATMHSGCWWVQIGSFQDEDNARRAREVLRRDGERAVIAPGPHGFHRVRVGPFESRNAATKAQRSLTAAWPPAQVVSSCGGS